MRNPFQLWERTHIHDLAEAYQKMVFQFKMDKPLTGGFDTETTGLHIIKDKPFLIQFGWLVPKQEFGRVYTFYPTPELMEIFFILARQLKYLVAHNIKYDLHMLSNIGYGHKVQELTNLTENMAIARLALEAIPVREGGDSLALKDLGKKYVHPEATKSESIIKDELHRLNAERIKVLTQALKQFPLEGEFTATGKQKYWGKGAIEKFLKDPTNDVEDLPEGVRDVWLDWLEEYPEPNYEDVKREIMIKYGAEDIITMLEFFKMAFPFVKSREQLPILETESKCILPMYRMERVGLKVDMPYLEESRLEVKAYITELRNEMCGIVTEKVTVNQHQRIKDIFKEKWNIHLDSDDAKAMKEIIKTYDGEPQRLAELIKSLRSLEKWYSTYIKRIIKNASYDGKVYTQINSAGAVSGRMSSDLQQQPKDPLLDLEGNELFHPRKAFVVDKSQFVMNAYIDYSQVELRVSADYTIKVMGGDVNLCRAYVPFKCIHYKTGEVFHIKNHKPRWSEKQENGESAWLVPETREPWTPTDMHSETTHNMLTFLGYHCLKKYEQYVNSNESTPFGKEIDKTQFKRLRGKLGKVYNFSKTYGVGIKTTMNNLNVSEEIATALSVGYETAFPGLITYQKAIEKAHHAKGYVFNAYGRRYYMQDLSKSYKLANHVIQGSCADALKQALIELDEYILANKLSTKLVLPVHDEQIFGIVSGDEEHIPKFIEIMQGVFKDWCLIPIISEPEVSYGAWADKEGYVA